MKNKRIYAVLVCIAMVSAFLTAFAEGRPKTDKNQYTIVFLGGSLTAGGSEWIKQTAESVGAGLGGKEVVTINAGKGGTGSDYGAARFMNDVGSLSPDMVVVEFAVNDKRSDEINSKVYMESIVRQCLSLPKVPAMLFLYAPQPVEEGTDGYEEMQNQKKWKDEIATHYGIKSIDVYEYMVEDFVNGQKYLTFDSYLGSMYSGSKGSYDVHGGYKKYAEAIKKAFDEDYNGSLTVPKKSDVYCTGYEDIVDGVYKYVDCTDVKITYDNNWQHYDINNQYQSTDGKLKINESSYSYPYFENGIKQTETAGTFSFKSSADAFCINYPSSTVGSSATVYIDGVKSDKKLSCWSGNQGVVYIGSWIELPGDGKEHEVKIAVDEPNDEKYIFRFGSIFERYKEFTETEAVIKTPETNVTKPVAAVSENGVTLFVSPDGDDEATGTIDNPFATIERAKNEVLTIKTANGGVPEGGICVYLREGVYSIHDTLLFTEEDSGTPEAPITYRAYKDEKVTLIGGEKLEVKDFRRVPEGEVLNRVYDRAARECLYQYDLSVFEDFEYGKIYTTGETNSPNELVIDGEIMTIARWPNLTADGKDQFEKVASVVNPDVQGKGFSFNIEDSARTNNWNNAKDARLVANWTYLWATQNSEIDNVKNGVITTKDKPGYKTVAVGTARFYALNLLEEIDQPGEFYIDKEAQKLYLYPPVNSTSKSDIYISTLGGSLVEIDGASNLTFRDFEIPCSRGAGFNIKSGDNNLVAYCNIRNLGGIGINIKGGTNNGAVSNFVSMCNGGIDVSGGDRQTLTPGNNYAINNETEKFSRITKTYRGGIHVTGIGNRVAYNEIHDGLHCGMQFEGNENIIEFNEFYDLLQSVDDSGGIYAGRTWFWRGNQIRNNYFHDFYGASGGVGLGAIYFDDSLSGNSVTGNVFYNIPGRAMWAEAGSDITVENNIMVNVGTPVRFADRGNNKIPYSEYKVQNPTNKHVTTANEVPYTSKAWLDKYPVLKNFDNEFVVAPHRNSIRNNVMVKSGSNDISPNVISQGTFENNIPMQDPGFVDLENGDFTLKADAPVYTQLPEFEDVKFERMGVFGEKLDEIVKDSIVLGIQKAGAKKNGEMTQVDVTNDGVMPIIINDRTMVPVRFISESLGAEVEWEEETKTVTVKYNGKTIKMQIDNSVMYTDGESVALDSAPTIRENRTLLPLRALVESLDKKVFWDDKGLIVIGDNAEIFDSVEDAYLIDELLRQIDLR